MITSYLTFDTFDEFVDPPLGHLLRPPLQSCDLTALFILQSSNEFEFTSTYPTTGGVSGMVSKYLVNALLSVAGSVNWCR